jgi:hypothetical protein
MPCSCKDKDKSTAKKKKVEEPIPLQVEMVQELTVATTLQEINIIENMLPDINSNPQKRTVIAEFMKKNFGDNVVNYCDQVCQKRLRDRLTKLKTTIN